jgi:VanZ family protein
MNLASLFSLVRSREFLSNWLPPLLFSAGILILSGDLGSSSTTRAIIEKLLSPWLPPHQIDQINHYLRMAGHIFAYSCLFVLWHRAFGGYSGSARQRSVLWSLGLCLAVSLMDEGRQSLVLARKGSLRDVGLDMASASLAAFVSYLIPALRVRRRSSI